MIKEFDMELLERLSKGYLGARKKEKSTILTKYQDITGLKRQTIIKRFGRFLKRKGSEGSKSQRGRKRKFKASHIEVIQRCWELSGNVCAEKIHPMLYIYVEQLSSNGLLVGFSSEVIEETLKMSLSTLKRIISTFPKPPMKRYKGNAHIYREIPIIADFGRYARKRPGFIEVDFVEHNGGRSDGTFAITGVYVDLYSQWTVRASGLGKNLQSISEIDNIAHGRIPFRILHYHPDNDKSILNVLFARVRNQRAIKLSRSRPYKKNDNAHVEQKGGDKVRKLIGYWRFDTSEDVRLINEIYKRADLIDNYFIACAKLKKRLKDSKGKTIKKIYEPPKTPFQRLIENKTIPESIKEDLRRTMKDLNMVRLKKEMDELIMRLMTTKINLRDKNYELTNTKTNSFQRQIILS